MGDSEGALRFFLGGDSLDKICDIAEFDEKRGGPFYGNVGRCLQMQDRLGHALVCYKKSARVLEASPDSDSVMNRGWAAYWLGEVLEKQGEWEKAFWSYKAAYCRWRAVSPKRGRQAADSYQRVRVRAPASAQFPDDEATCCRMFTELITSPA
jgi:tetratricopeptide (TPR) repeat protein